jgi:hypothetical protein
MQNFNATTELQITRRACLSQLGLSLVSGLAITPLAIQAAPAQLPAASSLPDELEKAL